MFNIAVLLITVWLLKSSKKKSRSLRIPIIFESLFVMTITLFSYGKELFEHAALEFLFKTVFILYHLEYPFKRV